MNPGLRFLLRKGAVGRLRSLKRRLRGWKGLALGGLFALLLVAIVMAQVVPRLLGEDVSNAVPVEQFRRYGPLGLLIALVMTAAAGRGLYFKPAEIAFLFPAPVSRRDLLLYNVLSRAGMTMLSGVWMSLFVFARSGSVFGTFVGYSLLMLFVQVWQQFTAVLGGALAGRIGRLGTLLRALVLGGLALSVWQAVGARTEPGIAGVADALHESPVIGTLAWVTRPYVELLVTHDVIEWLAWFVIAAALPLGMVGLVIALDLNFHESALERSRSVQQRLERMKSGGAFAGRAGGARFRLPRFPWMGGAGPIAWRQCVGMTRNYKGLVTALLFIGFLIAVIVAVPLVIDDGRDQFDPRKQSWAAIAMTVCISLVMTQNFAFDFRRDLDRMSHLKTLPISSQAIAVGELIPSAFAQLLIQVIGVLAVVAIGRAVRPQELVAVLLLLPPVNWATACLDNFVFLLLPYRMVTDDPGNLPFMGRLMLVMFLKFSTFLALGIAAGVAFGVVFLLSGKSLLAGTLAAFVVCLVACVPLTYAVAWAFRRFDVARDVPD